MKHAKSQRSNADFEIESATLPNAVEPSPGLITSPAQLVELDTHLMILRADSTALFQSFLYQILLQRHHSPCNAPRHTRHLNRRHTITKVMHATNLTLLTIPRVQDLTMVTVPLNPLLVFRTEGKSNNRHNTGRLYFSMPDTQRLPSVPGCNNSYNYSSATWARSAHSSATKTYTTSFDVKHCLHYFRIA